MSSTHSSGTTRRRVAVVAVGDPTDPTTWSGTPRGLMDGLAALGHDVVPIDAMPPRATRRLAEARITALRALSGTSVPWRTALWTARYGPEWSALLAATADRRLRSVRADLVIQAGEGWAVHHPRAAMYLDMTTRQTIDHRMFMPPADLSALDTGRLRAADAAFERTAAICAATPWAARSVIDDHGIPASKVHAVGIGARSLGNHALTRDFSTPHLLFVASRWERKNGPTVLAAFRRLRAEIPEATLDVVGEHPDLDEPGVTGHGVLARDDRGHQRTLADLYGRATCLAVPGSFEAAGIVFIEAAHQGIPAICGTVGGAADLVGSGGIAVPPGDEDSLYAAMRRVCGPDGVRMGRAAARRAENFTWTAVAERIVRSLEPDGPTGTSDWWQS